jgi:hypothetical protein
VSQLIHPDEAVVAMAPFVCNKAIELFLSPNIVKHRARFSAVFQDKNHYKKTHSLGYGSNK